ncbi:ABC transporter permease [Streptomyces sp. NPDC058284]|uniref:ABC transporter permease n=1 Tax=unclassified Streptomyces TaxID=2593676 RepID=UPI0036688DF7
MGRFVARRFGQMLIVLIGATIVLFVCLFVLPGDPIGSLAGGENAHDPVVVAELRERYGLGQPFYEQYFHYLGRLLTGDLGEDYVQRREVSEILAPKLWNTAQLALAAIVINIAVGVPVGVLAALRKYSIWDVSATFVSTLTIGFPTFVIGFLLQKFFVVELGWFPLLSTGNIESLVLPAVTLAIVDAALVARLMRGTMLEVLQADYIKTAVAKGLPPRTVLFKHVLRNSIIPVVTYLGISLGLLMGGALIAEAIFNWDGVGLALVNAVRQQNNPVVLGVVTYGIAVFVVLSLLVDLLCAALDPRIRES